jgi:hypothetical protein
MSHKVVIVHKNPRADNPDACHAGLGVTAGNTAEVLREYGIEAQSMPVVDGYYLRDKLRTIEFSGVTHVVMCAPFFDTTFLKALCEEFRRIEFSIVFHSNVGFLGVDNWSTGILVEQIALMESVKNFRVAANSQKFKVSVEAMFGQHCTLLPNLYFLHGPIQRQRIPWHAGSGPLRIGAFGAIRLLKNLPTAAWAAGIICRQLGVKTEFWISAGREEGAGGPNVILGIRNLFRSQPDITLVMANWSGWLDFRRDTVRKMNLLMQPSFTESFNGVTADGIAEGVPSVVGEAINWVPSNWMADSDDAVDVARIGMALLRDKNVQRDGYRALVAHNESGISAWKQFL